MVAAALLAGAALRAAFVLLAPHIMGDTLVYGDLAANLLHKHVYGLTEGAGIRPTLIRLPGYPLFLAACFAVFGAGKYTAVLWVQAVADLVTCWLVGETAYAIAGRRAGLAALWLAALCPFTANYVAAPLTETLVLLTVAVAFYALVRWLGSQGKENPRWVWLVGVALGYSVLLRPDQGLLAVAIVWMMIWFALRVRGVESSKKLLNVVMVSAIVAAPLAVWGARNWHVFHVVQPLAPRFANDPGERVNYGFQRWYRTWGIEFASTDAVYWTYDGAPILMDALPARACDNAAQCAETSAALNRYNQTSAATAASDADFAKLADDRVHHSPLRYYVAMPVARLADMWLRPRVEMLPIAVRWWRWREHPWQTLFGGAYAVLNLALLVVGVAGVGRWWQRGREKFGAVGAAMVLFVLLRCALLLTIDNSEPRYTLECFPVLLVWVGMWFAKRDIASA